MLGADVNEGMCSNVPHNPFITITIVSQKKTKEKKPNDKDHFDESKGRDRKTNRATLRNSIDKTRHKVRAHFLKWNERKKCRVIEPMSAQHRHKTI